VNEEQLRLFLQQAFALSAREVEILKSSDPALLQAMKNIRAIAEQNLPDDGILREQTWRQLRPLIAQELGPLNDAFARSVYEGLSDEVGAMAMEAVAMVGAVTSAPVTGLQLADSVEAILRTQVGNRRLAGLFERSDLSGLSPFIRSNLDAINRRVVEGIIKGTPTREIAESIAMIDERLGREYISTRGSTAGREIRSNMQAIARTAVQDANRQVHEDVYKANADQLSDLQWEWVAVLDSRTCPTCAPLDGKRWDKRRDAPRWPVHVNCRCQVVAVDPDEEADVRSGQVVSPEPMTGDRAYKTKTKVKGESLHRKAVDVKPGKDGKPPTYADFLAQSNQKTQQMFFGGGNAGSVRAESFRRAVKGGVSPEKALRDLINTSQGVGRFKPAKGL